MAPYKTLESKQAIGGGTPPNSKAKAMLFLYARKETGKKKTFLTKLMLIYYRDWAFLLWVLNALLMTFKKADSQKIFSKLTLIYNCTERFD